MADILEEKFFSTCFLNRNNQDEFTVVVQAGHKSPVCYHDHYHEESSAHQEGFVPEVHDSSGPLQTTHITYVSLSVNTLFSGLPLGTKE